ncbi:MAG TPA: hypothetical protein VES19_01590 [Candidatus Limnocylindrales bacterium]|nr:hypothetical protein [Candidatus Limnocylindrales bacterium]
MTNVIRVLVETTPKKAFVSALDWPGLSRAGRDEPAAIDALLAAAPRYAEVARAAGMAFGSDDLAVEVHERRDGDATTAFGVPSIVADADRRPADAREAATLAALVEASWAAFDRIAAAAPEALRKGPRGGGRDRTKVMEHVNGGDASYASVIGIPAADRRSGAELRARVFAILREPSDGSPLAGKRWPPRYAARRIAWHALDHAWEIEDRTEPA